MAMSGVACDDTVVNAFNDQKLKKTHKFIKYHISDTTKKIEVLESGDCDWNDFVASLPKEGCIYATYDFEFEYDGSHRTKLVFLAWCPDEAPARKKMIYASSKEAVTKKLEGVQVVFQANSYADCSYAEVFERASKKV